MQEKVITQKKPFVLEVEPGKYAWCACGKSSNQPYCDGSHKGSGYRPVIEEIAEKKKIAWCGCRHSGKVPFCDGTHKNI